MGQRYFYVNDRTGRRYEVIGIDTSAEPNTITLKGELSTFTEPWDKSKFKAMGYRRVVEETEDVDA
jgi:hypothetical protein